MMNPKSRILIAGNDNGAGPALVRSFKDSSQDFFSLKSSDCLESEILAAVFEDFKPEYVFLAAGKSGGIAANQKYPADFMRKNLLAVSLVLEAARKYKVQKLLYTASSCVYPKDAPQPMRPDILKTAPLEPTCEPYAMAKLSGLELCRAYRTQYGCQFIGVIPSDAFGPDSFHGEDSHVVASLILKMHDAKLKSKSSVTLWGTGAPIRDFIYSEDLASGLIYLMDHYNEASPINLTAQQPFTICDLAEQIKSVVGYQGTLLWDRSRPDGALEKVLDPTALKKLGWKPAVKFAEALRKTYEAYLSFPEPVTHV